MQFKICELVLPALRNIKHAQQSSHISYSIPISLLLLEKKDVMYVTDGYVILQALMCLTKQQENSRDDLPKPFNIIRTSYYNFQVKQSNLFMFNKEDINDTKFPSVYEPKFHFGEEKISLYRKDNGFHGFQSLTEVLLVKEWGLRIVNIANTGYYGMVLEIYNYERNRSKFNLHHSLHSILYQKQIVRILEELRIRDMRQQIGIPKKENQVSLCYYRKNVKTTRNTKTHRSSFVNPDRTNKYIKFNHEFRQYYIPLGDISGALRFIRPLTNFSESKRTHMNFNLFQPKQDLEQIDDELNERQEFSQFESESQSQDAENLSDAILQDLSQQSESSDEQEQPLKVIYLKQLENIKII